MANYYSPDDYPITPPPRDSWINITLCILNVVLVIVFCFCLLLDVWQRQAWAYAVFLRDLRVMGLPLAEEEEGPNGSRPTLPMKTLTSAQLQAAYKTRVEGANRKTSSSRIIPWRRVLPRYIDDATLKHIFGDLKPYVHTLDGRKSIASKGPFSTKLPGLLKIPPMPRRPPPTSKKLREVLLPLARNVMKVRTYDVQCNDPKLDEAALDKP